MAKSSVCAIAVFSLLLCSATQAETRKKQLLFVGMSQGWHHESVSDAMATLYQLGKESGLWETTFRTDVGAITKKKLESNAKNLDDFDAIFFMTTGELPLDEQQRADLLAFVHKDGKGFLGAHNATDTFYKWPEYGEMIGGWFDGHPWNQFLATMKVEERDFPATRHFPASFEIKDEIYQTKNFVPGRYRVLMTMDTSKADMTAKGVPWLVDRLFDRGVYHAPTVQHAFSTEFDGNASFVGRHFQALPVRSHCGRCSAFPPGQAARRIRRARGGDAYVVALLGNLVRCDDRRGTKEDAALGPGSPSCRADVDVRGPRRHVRSPFR